MNSDFDQKNEIGILELIRQITRGPVTFSARISYYFKWYMRMLFANAWIFFTIIILTVSAAFLARTFLPKYYKTQGVWVANNISPKLAEQVIANFNLIKNEVPYQQTMGVSNAAAASIKDISFSYKMGDDTINTFFPFNVMLSIKDTSYIDEVQGGITALFTRNKLINKKFLENQEQLRKKRSLCLQRLSRIDSLKQMVKTLVSEKNHSPAINYFNSINSSTLFDAEVNANNELAKIDLALKDGAIDVIEPFYRPQKATEPNVNLIFWKILLAGIFLALILPPVFGKKRIN